MLIMNCAPTSIIEINVYISRLGSITSSYRTKSPSLAWLTQAVGELLSESLPEPKQSERRPKTSGRFLV